LHEVKNSYFEGKEEFENKINKANTTMSNGFMMNKTNQSGFLSTDKP